MFVTPVKMVVRKQIDAHAQRIHLPELRSVSQLTML